MRSAPTIGPKCKYSAAWLSLYLFLTRRLVTCCISVTTAYTAEDKGNKRGGGKTKGAGSAAPVIPKPVLEAAGSQSKMVRRDVERAQAR